MDPDAGARVFICRSAFSNRPVSVPQGQSPVDVCYANPSGRAAPSGRQAPDGRTALLHGDNAHRATSAPACGIPHAQLGGDCFAGWQDGAPHPIDTTAGGVAPSGVRCPCGFVPNGKDDPVNGADAGACHFVNQTCSQLTTPMPGRTCLERRGNFAPAATCRATPPFGVDFTADPPRLTQAQPARRKVTAQYSSVSDSDVEYIPLGRPLKLLAVIRP